MRAFAMPVSKLARSVAAALALTGASVMALEAHASIVERVVAIVGERPILLSELRRRARPFMFRIIATAPTSAQQAAAESEMFKELLNRMIDDRLEENAADKAHLSVTSEELDNALANVAANAHIGVPELLAEARHQGLTEQDYRDEIRRQILEGKLVQLRVRGRVRVTEQDARAAYQHWLHDNGGQTNVDVRILALRLLPGSTDPQKQARQVNAQALAEEARKPDADFCKLVLEYSDDKQTKDACGSRGLQPFSSLVPQIQNVVESMKPGEVSDAFRVGDEAVLVVKLQDSKVPTYDEVKGEMEQRAYTEAMDRQRRQWLGELRRNVYVDVRL